MRSTEKVLKNEIAHRFISLSKKEDFFPEWKRKVFSQTPNISTIKNKNFFADDSVPKDHQNLDKIHIENLRNKNFDFRNYYQSENNREKMAIGYPGQHRYSKAYSSGSSEGENDITHPDSSEKKHSNHVYIWESVTVPTLPSNFNYF